MSSQADILCRCFRVPRHAIRQMVVEQNANLAEVIQATGASNNCGGCYDDLIRCFELARAQHQRLRQGQPELPFA